MLPSNGGSDDQRKTLAGFSPLEFGFHHFAQQLVTGTIKDSGGGTLPVPFNGLTEFYDVAKDTHVYPVKTQPFTVPINEFVLQPGATYTFQKTQQAYMKDRVVASLRRSTHQSWLDLVNSDQTIDMSCDDAPAGAEVLATRTNDTPDSLPLDVTIQTQPKVCPCIPTVTPLDPCLVGTWELDNSAIDEALKKALPPSVTYLGTSGKLMIEVHADKSTTLSFHDWSNSLAIKGIFSGDIPVENIFQGLLQGQVGSSPSGNVCFRPSSDQTRVISRIHLGEETPIEHVIVNPFSKDGGVSDNETSMVCGPDKITYHISIPPRGSQPRMELDGFLHKR